MKSKLFLSLAASALAFFNTANAQDAKPFEPSGKVSGQIFLNYHYDLSKNAEKTSQFEITRGQMGYAYKFSEKINTNVVLDAAHNNSVYGIFIKTATLNWDINSKLTLESGFIGTHAWDLQDRFNGYRYVAKDQQDEYGWYSPADLGVKLVYKPIKMLDLHASFTNGEGAKGLQDKYGQHRAAFDFVLKPIEGLYFKTYYDFNAKKDTSAGKVIKLKDQQMLCFFLGYEKKDKFRVGAEYNMMDNCSNKDGRSLNGISVTAAYNLKKVEIFGRFDQLTSNKLSGAANSWNLGSATGWTAASDNSLIIGGIQYALVKGVKVALNYRHYIPRVDGADAKQFVYMNFEYKF